MLADRYYCTSAAVCAAPARGAGVAWRLRGSRQVDFRLGRRLGPADRLVWWQEPRQRPAGPSPAGYAELPPEPRARAVRARVRQKGFRVDAPVVVTTTLEAARASAEDLAELYRARGRAGLNPRSLRTAWQTDISRGRSPGGVGKEVWGHLLVYTTVRGLMAQAARAAGLLPREVSSRGALQTSDAFRPPWEAGPGEAEALRLWLVMIRAISRHEVGARPDRYEPRKVKRRPKECPRLTGPRARAERRLATRT